ncbi:MAG: GntR family transcriptional regulator [Thermodesulfobacteriota bacterium]
MPRKAKTKNKIQNGGVYKRGSSIDEAHQKIKEMLYVNELSPGQKIVCVELGRRLGISITPVVQALNRLEASGFVSYVPNTGYFVCEISESEANELFEARKALELHVVPKVIDNLQEHQLAEIQTNFQKHRHEMNELSGRALAFLDARFHLAIAALAGNEFINRILKEIFEKLYLKFRPENVAHMDSQKILEEHRVLFEALRNRDEKKVTEALHHHLDSAQQRFLDRLRDQKKIVMF